MDLLMGKSDQGRDELVVEATSRTAFKKGDWVMIPPYKGPSEMKRFKLNWGIIPIFNYTTLLKT